MLPSIWRPGHPHEEGHLFPRWRNLHSIWLRLRFPLDFHALFAARSDQERSDSLAAAWHASVRDDAVVPVPYPQLSDGHAFRAFCDAAGSVGSMPKSDSAAICRLAYLR
jgi:hypothetical protein